MSTDDKPSSINSPPFRVTIETMDDEEMEDQTEEVWDDQKIDKEAKSILKEPRLG